MYSKNLPLLFFCMLFAGAMQAQQDTLPSDFVIKGKAIGISAPELIDQMMAVMPGFETGAKKMVSEQTVKPFIMPPRSAKGKAASTTYTLATCMEFYTNFESNYKLNLSPDFVKLNLQKKTGVNIKDALRYLVTDGTVSADVVPFESNTLPKDVSKSRRYLIDNYLQVFSQQHRTSQKIFQIQKALMKGNPVIVELKIPADFEQVKDTRFYSLTEDLTDEVLPFLVVSYDLQLEAFEVMSAWGREWGYNGYLWIDFDDLATMAQNGYVMVPVR
ncbi:MAG: hypothetical protein CMN32_06795 [Saprospirales bacterium]|nr:hypothetical protein [Saprospirales bacterium]